MFRDLLASMGLGYRLFLRDFTAKYRQSLFGMLWVVFLPLFTVSVFVGMHKSGILNSNATSVPYTVFVLFGMTIWTLFTGLISSIAGIVGQSSGFITKINFQKIALVLSPILVSFVDFMVRLILLAIVMIITKTVPSGYFFLFPLVVLPIIFLAVGLGMFFAPIGAVFKDIPNFLNIFLSVAMFLMPVVYLLPGTGIIYQINMYNPLYYLLDESRNIFFAGNIVAPQAWSLSALFSLVIFFAGWRFYHVSISRIVEKV
jgi:lipopolysaccharide transport system permease protein